MCKQSSAVVLAAVLATAALPASGADALRICLAADNPPFSTMTGERHGIDHDVMAELAVRLGRSMAARWVTIPNRGGLGKALQQAFASGECEIFAGVPLSDGRNEDLQAQGLASSRPYLTTGYALVVARGSSVRTLADARAAGRVGAVSATPADLYLFEQQMHRRPFGSNEALLAALDADEIDAALFWLPALARVSDGGRTLWPGALRLGEVQDGRLRAGFVVALGPTSTLTGAVLDQALAAMAREGAIAEIAGRYGLPTQ
ncbi:MAG: transporter substrate-binding domain-containing protein [Rhodocyclaceae bacterium]|nr:transporter substrate-binding domain-containing protein [Rhodocyclaceae bacterium]